MGSNEKIEIVIGAKDEYSRELARAKASFGDLSSAAMSWTEFLKGRMGPAMKQFGNHTDAIRHLSAEYKQYKATGVAAVTNVATAQESSFSALKTSATQAIGALALVYGSIKSLGVAWDAAREAANYDEQKTALNALAEQYGTTADTMISSFQRAVSGTVSQSEAMAVSVRALHANMSPAIIEKYAAAAERLSPILGVSTVEAFDKFAQAAATGKEKTLTALRMQVDLVQATDDVGKHMGAAAIQAKNYQLVADALDKSMKNLGDDSVSNADKFDQMDASVADLKQSFAEHLVPTISAVAAELARMARVGIKAIAAITPQTAAEKRIAEWRAEVEKLDERLLVATGTAKNFWGGYSISSDYAIDNLQQMRAEQLGWIAESEAAITASNAKKAALKAARAASAKGPKDGGNEDPAAAAAVKKSYEEIEAKIQAVYFATEKLGASKTRIAELEAYEATAASGNIEQINRYTDALAAKAVKEDEIAMVKAQRELSQMKPVEVVNASPMSAADVEVKQMNDNIAHLNKYYDDKMKHLVKDARWGEETAKLMAAKAVAIEEQRQQIKFMAAQVYSVQSLTLINDIGVLIGNKGRTLFEINKALSILNAQVKGAPIVRNAYRDGARIFWVVGVIMAAIAAAAVLARIKQIQDTEYDSGSGTIDNPPSGSYGSSISSTGAGVPPPVAADSTTSAPQEVTVTVYNPQPKNNWAKMVEDNIIPALNDAINRNVSLTVKNMGAA